MGRSRILIAGGGVGALESALALRELVGPLAAIALATPAEALEYRPLAVAEPFGYAATHRLEFSRLERTHGVTHRPERIDRVDVAGRRALGTLTGWSEYDALVVAVGARPRRWLEGALTFGGARDVDAYRALLEAIRMGEVRQVVFVQPPELAWPLPLYELALLTAAWAAEQGATELELDLVVADAAPLADFGPAAGLAVRDLLSDRGIRLHPGRKVERVRDGRAWLDTGDWLHADRLITLPMLTGAAPEGLPIDASGFLPVADDGAVQGAPGVWAIGDATSRSVKHGGLAAQQADVAAAAIAAHLGVAVPAPAISPTMHGVLLTGVASAYLRAELTGRRGSEVAFNPLWSPPVKVAGRLLAPYLAGEAAILATPAMRERAPVTGEQAPEDRVALRELALTFATDDAARGEHRSALRWLQTVEWLDGALTPDLASLRDAWERTGTAG